MDIPAFFQSLADDFMSGDHHRFANAYLHPLVIYAPEGIRIERSLPETFEVLSRRLASARMAGAVKAVSEVRETSTESLGRIPVDVKWRYLSKENVQTGLDEIRYFLRKDGQGNLRIELLEVFSTTLTQHPPKVGQSLHARHTH